MATDQFEAHAKKVKLNDVRLTSQLLRNCFLTLFAIVASAVGSLGCEKAPIGSTFSAALGLNVPKLLIANSNPGNETISMHDMDGNFISLLADYSLPNQDPQGIWPLSGTDYLVAINGTDQIERRNIFGVSLFSIIDSNLNGNIFNLLAKNDKIHVIEGNVVESFSLTGQRISNPRINTTVGACVLNVPRGIAENAAGHLVLVGTGNDRITIYDVSNPATTTCVASNATIGNNDPVAVIAHSNGRLYVATQTNDAIYEFAGDGSGTGTIIYQPGIAVLNNPTALLEMPDGSLLVASDGTNNILRITTTGTVLASPFMQNSFTGLVLQMAIMPGGE